ncbi:MAG: fasciclin domain-containing protein [Betaproteobacteria bacterium]|nr:fasciclin domain-containing protein [Betaproteobacteria bacterium]
MEVVSTPPAFIPRATTPAGRRADLIDALAGAGLFAVLSNGLKSTALETLLRAPGPYTVFAPTDLAFGKMDPGARQALFADKPALSRVLCHHIVAGRVTAKDIRTFNYKTLTGETIRVVSGSGALTVNGVNVSKVDIAAPNGVIHALDRVLTLA